MDINFPHRAVGVRKWIYARPFSGSGQFVHALVPFPAFSLDRTNNGSREAAKRQSAYKFSIDPSFLPAIYQLSVTVDTVVITVTTMYAVARQC